jgi:hypothetical protein
MRAPGIAGRANGYSMRRKSPLSCEGSIRTDLGSRTTLRSPITHCLSGNPPKLSAAALLVSWVTPVPSAFMR